MQINDDFTSMAYPIFVVLPSRLARGQSASYSAIGSDELWHFTCLTTKHGRDIVTVTSRNSGNTAAFDRDYLVQVRTTP